MILPPPATDIPRFLSYSLPEYRYVPKYLPHPFRSDNGHRHMKKIRSRLQNINEEEMLDIFWLHGCDLFSYRYYWEAHEFWEEVWKSKTGLRKREVQAAIKMSASILKRHMNHIDPAQKLWNHSFEVIQKSTDPFLLFWCHKAEKYHQSTDWKHLEMTKLERERYKKLISLSDK